MRSIILFSTVAAFVAIQCFEGCEREDMLTFFVKRLPVQAIANN